MADGETSGKKPLMKMLLLAVVGALLVGVLAGGGFFVFRKMAAAKAAKATPEEAQKAADDKDKDTEEDEDEPAAAEGEGATGPAVLVYKNNVNLENKHNAYLVVELHVLFRDQELGKLATSDKPTPENSIVRAMILEAISGKTIEEVSDMESRETVRAEIKERLNEKFAPKLKPGEKEDKKHKKPKHPIKDVLVVSWAIAQ